MIKPKISTCVTCSKTKPIYAKKMCGWCYEKQRNKMPLKQAKKPIKQFSKKSLDNLKRYRILRDKYLKENPVCQYPGCQSRDVTLHHRRGRVGAYLTDKRFFSALCWPHHQHIELNPDLAKQLGLSLSRLENHD